MIDVEELKEYCSIERRRRYHHKYYQENVDRYRKNNSAAERRRIESGYYKTGDGLKRWLLKAAKQRARKKGLEFQLSINDFEVPEFCPVLGIKLESGIGKQHDASPSLDRINNDLGYVIGNVIVVSMKANRIKSNATINEILQVASFYRRMES